MSQQDFATIPILDMSQYASGSAAEQQCFILKLRAACHDVGFFYLQHHGIAPESMQEILHLTKTFFNLPQSDKEQISIYHSPHYRGYGKLNAETTLGVADFKETYDLGLESFARPHSDDQPYMKLHGPNQWPSSNCMIELHFKERILQYLHAMQQLGCQLMRAMTSALELPANTLATQFNPDTDDAYAMLRLLHYPPADQNHQQNFGVGPHVDAGCLVFLLQDETGGLQVQNRNKEWIAAPPLADTYIVNIGQMLQIWSSHYFKATPHRVMNNSSHHRYSAPFFFEPNLSTCVSSLPVFDRRPAAPSEQIIYGEHMLKIFSRSFINNN
jgi:isopenicillin N synthase-like dioxygenase